MGGRVSGPRGNMKTSITIAVEDETLLECVDLVRVDREWNPDLGRWEYEPVFEFVTFCGCKVEEADEDYIADLIVRDYVESKYDK